MLSNRDKKKCNGNGHFLALENFKSRPLSHTKKIIPISHKSETIQKKENPQMSKFDRRQQRQLQFFMLKKN